MVNGVYLNSAIFILHPYCYIVEVFDKVERVAWVYLNSRTLQRSRQTCLHFWVSYIIERAPNFI